MKNETKELIKSLHETAALEESCISFLQTAIIYNNPKPLTELRSNMEKIKAAETELTKKIASIAQDAPDIKPYVGIPSHLLRIAENMEKIAELTDRKIKDNILFSDKAVTEITFLLQRLSDILKPTSEIILAKNIFLNRYIQESENAVVRRATEYATLHEERLIEGLCMPSASSIYIGMLDHTKSIAWHAKEIASNLVEWMLPKA
jgi:Na+/phosphate symporter